MTTTHVSVTDIDGWGPEGFWLVVRDHRFELDYEISSHADYWDFIAALVDHKQFIRRPPAGRVMAERTASGRSYRAATSAGKSLPAEVLPDAAKSETCDGPSQRSDGDNDHRAEESLGELIHTETLQVDGVAKCCYWCHELLPPLPEDASYVDEINRFGFCGPAEPTPRHPRQKRLTPG